MTKQTFKFKIITPTGRILHDGVVNAKNEHGAKCMIGRAYLPSQHDIVVLEAAPNEHTRLTVAIELDKALWQRALDGEPFTNRGGLCAAFKNECSACPARHIHCLASMEATEAALAGENASPDNITELALKGISYLSSIPHEPSRKSRLFWTVSAEHWAQLPQSLRVYLFDAILNAELHPNDNAATRVAFNIFYRHIGYREM